MTLEQAFESHRAALDARDAAFKHWNGLVDQYGEDSPQARAYETNDVNPALAAERAAEQALVQAPPLNPFDTLRKIAAIGIKGVGLPDGIHDEVKRQVNAATD